MRRFQSISVFVLVLSSVCSAAPLKGRRMEATAYCQSGPTASGTAARPGVIAADPGVLPAGTVVRIEVPVRGYSGTYRVEDRGARVTGRVIDIFIPDCKAARRFGRRRVTVHVLHPASERRIAERE